MAPGATPRSIGRFLFQRCATALWTLQCNMKSDVYGQMAQALETRKG